jgi:SAM-dependent methyltransferase
MTEITPPGPVDFACPKCKHALQSAEGGLSCPQCDRTYPIVGGIPDFLSGNPEAAPLLRIAGKADLLAPWYESRLWYQFALRVGGARRSSLDTIARFHSESLRGVSGAVLDVACGPATYSRRVASPSRDVYGIDISLGMLRKGTALVAREHASAVHLARACVEELPFGNAVFGGAICSGALHLFPDTVSCLREIARALKTEAPLTVQTFVGGSVPISALVRLSGLRGQVHAFELPELQQHLTEAGFEGFRSEMDGSVLTFSTRKAAPGDRPSPA